MSLFNQQDEPIVVAINERGVFIIDHINGVSGFTAYQPILLADMRY